MNKLRKIEAMHKEYGINEQHICKACINFGMYQCNNKRVSKCMAYGLTHSEASDWNGRNTACGLFGKLFGGSNRTPLIEVLKRAKKEVDFINLDGQISLLD